jgi:hypothetical protein
MNAIVAASLVLTFAAATSWAQLPSSNDVSDSFANTGGGTGALASDTASSCCQSNTAYGNLALQMNTTGTDNTAFGVSALRFSNATENTAVGVAALLLNTNGGDNTAIGYDALDSNTTAGFNTAVGAAALASNSTGVDNTATGYNSLTANTTGFNNTADGWQALLANTTGIENTATGEFAMQANTKGEQNTADGKAALFGSTGSFNTGTGYKVLFSNTGNNNTGAGWESLFNNTSGSKNIAFGFQAGFSLTTGSNNIEIGNLGASSDSRTIRIGSEGTQTRTFIAGVSSTVTGGSEATELVVNKSTGQVGVIPSSARFKRDIQALGERSSGLWQLRPVTFRYKQDPQGQRQYGLIAEEVAKIYPELVVRDERGQVESVQYREFIPLMLNEMQHQRAALTELKAQNETLQAALAQQNTLFAARLERLEQASRSGQIHASLTPPY